MTRGLSEEDYTDPVERKFISNINRVGWNVPNVIKVAGETGPNWSFSCGLYHTYRHPEIVVFGLHHDRLTGIINAIGREVSNGAKFEFGRESLTILEGYPCAFREIAVQNYHGYLGWAIWFYERAPFPVLQCFWPDKGGFYPWDARCNAFVSESQPLLFKPS